MGDKPPLVDPDRLRPWLDDAGIEPGAPLAVARITTGHSNEVFLVERGDRQPGAAPAAAHAAVADRARHGARAPAPDRVRRSRRRVPVPQPVALCTDPEVIGAPFYLMERLEGIVVRDTLPEAFTADEGAPAAFAHSLVDLLVATHAFDWRAGGLDGFGKPDGYLDRQVPRWLGQLEKYRTRDIPEVEEAGRWLAAHTPPMQDPTVIHGDYKLDNVMFLPAPPVRPLAVLDWEQATIGDPLVDLGWLLGLWLDEGETASFFGGGERRAVRPRAGPVTRGPRGSLRRGDRARPHQPARSTACSACSSSRA